MQLNHDRAFDSSTMSKGVVEKLDLSLIVLDVDDGFN